MTSQSQEALRYAHDRDLARRYKVSRNTIWRWVREGRLPAPVRLSPGCTRWNLDEIEAFEAKAEGGAA